MKTYRIDAYNKYTNKRIEKYAYFNTKKSDRDTIIRKYLRHLVIHKLVLNEAYILEIVT